MSFSGGMEKQDNLGRKIPRNRRMACINSFNHTHGAATGISLSLHPCANLFHHRGLGG